MNFFKWLYPGLHVKRWLTLALAGLLLILAGVTILADLLLPGTQAALISLSRNWFGYGGAWVGGTFSLLGGLAVLLIGLYQAFNSIIAVLAPGDGSRLVDILFNKRYLSRGPRIVVIGGGTGLSVLLRGLKRYTSNLTAIVTVADDGGSSGRLRGDLGILPPGDIRNCLVALADKETLMEDLLQYRFPSGELAGHNLGNLLLAALNELNGGFHEAVNSLSEVLAIRGQVLPATLENVVLGAELSDGTLVYGESVIPLCKRRIKRVFLEPEDCYPVAGALRAIEEADAVVLGPGSLYTSVIPNLLVRGVPEAIKKSSALKIYVCNVMTQPGETDGYSASDHLKAILNHVGSVVDYIVVNREEIPSKLRTRYRKQGAIPVVADLKEIEKNGVKAVPWQLVQESDVVRHHPEKLARLIMRLVLLQKRPK